jgi:hypothetical protein
MTDNDIEYENVKCEFECIYEDWYDPQVKLGNIPSRTFETRCRCHPNIVNEIINNDLLLNLDQSYYYNHPKKNFNFIPEDYDKVIWVIDRLQDIYEDTIFGNQCIEDVKNIHFIFWRKLNKTERKDIRRYINTRPIIIDKTEGEIVFKWCNWKEFSIIMCAVYQKSFDHIEIN